MKFNHLARRLLLLIPPIALILLEWWHPTDFSKNVFSGLYPQREW